MAAIDTDLDVVRRAMGSVGPAPQAAFAARPAPMPEPAPAPAAVAPSEALRPVVHNGEAWLNIDGQYFGVAPDKLGRALEQHPTARLATADEVAQRQAVLEQGGFVGGLKTAAKSAATHAFDAATALIRVPAELAASAMGDEKALREIHELTGEKVAENLAYIAGELRGESGGKAAREWREARQAGAEAHPYVDAGAGLVGDVAGGLGLEGAGRGLAGAATRALEGRVAPVASRIVGKLAEGAVVGGALGAGQAHQQAYIEDEPITRQKLLAGMGLGAALGAGGSGVIQGAVEGAGAARTRLARVFGSASKVKGAPAEEALEDVAGRALGGDAPPPAPGLGGKLRDAIESAQAAATGADRDALRKYGPLRWDDEALRGRELAFRRDEILDGAKGALAEDVQRLTKSSSGVLDEVRDMGLKREQVRKLIPTEGAATQVELATTQLRKLEEQLAEMQGGGAARARPRAAAPEAPLNPDDVPHEAIFGAAEHRPERVNVRAVNELGLENAQYLRDGYRPESLPRIREGAAEGKLPPVTVNVADDGTVSLVDGRHRMLVAGERGEDTIRAHVRQIDANGDIVATYLGDVPLKPRPAAAAAEVAPAAGRDFGNRALLKDTTKLISGLRQRVESSGDAADAFIALDEAKRALQRQRVSLGESAIRQSNAYKSQQARALGDAFSEMQEGVRQGLMAEDTWGKAATAQKAINAAWEDWFTHKQLFEGRFLTKTGREFTGRPIYEADPQKIGSYVERLGLKESALLDKHFRGYVEATKNLASAVDDAYELGAKRAAVAEAKAAAKAIGETLGKADRTVAVANQIGELLHAESPTSMLGHAGFGAILGGHAGAALGAVVGAITNPGSQLKAAWGIQRVVHRVDDFIRKSIDETFAGARARVAAGADKLASGAAAAKRAAVPAGLALTRFAEDGQTRQLAYDRRREQVASLIASPQKLAAVIEKHVAPTASASPMFTASLAGDMARMIAALQQAAPPEQTISTLTPRKDKAFVSSQEIERFAEAWEGIVSPLSLLDDLKNGTLSYAKRDAVAMAYPDLMADMQRAALEKIATSTETLPLQTRTQLDLMLGLNGAGEPSLSPDFLRRQAERAAATRNYGQPPARPSRLTAGQRKKTLTEAATSS